MTATTEPTSLRVRVSGVPGDAARTVWWECSHCRGWGSQPVSGGDVETRLEELLDSIGSKHRHEPEPVASKDAPVEPRADRPVGILDRMRGRRPQRAR